MWGLRVPQGASKSVLDRQIPEIRLADIGQPAARPFVRGSADDTNRRSGKGRDFPDTGPGRPLYGWFLLWRSVRGARALGWDIGWRFCRTGQDIPDGKVGLHIAQCSKGISKEKAETRPRFASNSQNKLRYNPGPGLSYFASRMTWPAKSHTPRLHSRRAGYPDRRLQHM